jgi:hypothetical protein
MEWPMAEVVAWTMAGFVLTVVVAGFLLDVAIVAALFWAGLKKLVHWD